MSSFLTSRAVEFAWYANIFCLLAITPFIADRTAIILATNLVAGLSAFPLILDEFQRRNIHQEVWLFLSFIGWCLATLLLSSEFGPSSWRWLSVMVKSWFVVLVLPIVIMQSRKYATFLFVYGLGCVFSCLSWLVWSNTFGSDLQQTLSDFDRGDDPNFFGGLASFGIIAILGLYPYWRMRIFLTTAFACAASILLLALVASASRAAAGMLVLFIPFWLIYCLPGGGNGWFAKIVLFFLIAWVVFEFGPIVLENTYLGTRINRVVEGEDHSANVRRELFLQGFELFYQDPVFGVGIGNFSTRAGGKQAHSELAEILSSTGIPGALLYYGIYAVLIKRCFLIIKMSTHPWQRFLGKFLLCSVLVFVLVGAVTNSNFLMPSRVMWLSVLIGMALAVENGGEPNGCGAAVS